MKCQKCSRPVTYHITDIENRKIREYHFCDEHAIQHLQLQPTDAADDLFTMSKLAKELMQQASPSAASGSGAGSGTGANAPAQSGTKDAEASTAERSACPLCGMTFAEFRNTGRLGCPHDYDVFRDELMPLLENIHEDTRHAGKTPRRAPRGSQQLAQLIQLRNDLKKAIVAEDYETAARLRDEIRTLEQESGIHRLSRS